MVGLSPFSSNYVRKYGGGSPATEQLNGGIESVDLAGKDSSASSEGSKNANTSLEGGDTSDNSSINNASFQVDNDDSERDTHHTEEPDHSQAHTDGSVATTIKQRRELLNNQLTNYKQACGLTNVVLCSRGIKDQETTC